MRTLILTLVLLLTLSPALFGCAAKDDAGPDADAASVQTADGEGDEEPVEEEEETAKPLIDPDEMVLGPVANLHLDNGDIVEAANFERLGPYYVYVVGKYNGRASTVISLTRLSDLRRWAAIVFTGPGALTIVTRDERELQFTDAAVYLGSESAEEYVFYSLNPMSISDELRTLPKSRVKVIEILLPQEAP